MKVELENHIAPVRVKPGQQIRWIFTAAAAFNIMYIFADSPHTRVWTILSAVVTAFSLVAILFVLIRHRRGRERTSV